MPFNKFPARRVGSPGGARGRATGAASSFHRTRTHPDTRTFPRYAAAAAPRRSTTEATARTSMTPHPRITIRKPHMTYRNIAASRA
ncbi:MULTISPECIES: hypothetical protein [Actinomycetaceae]|uniref:Uncharacterized protein n=1 Tax=Schaalia turicensis TaxID=131111 RepID=A0ABZ0RA78_9ACTO|nr:hypothetical protein [Actinotignum sanguinis]MDK8748654.1 hypothetical protein [Actinotignum sanguinis]MDV2436541.1 hypothetical protein [Actinotignum sanguinis]WPJ88897.1 hypothetical protein R0V15_08565 [Schaalia turicensis]